MSAIADVFKRCAAEDRAAFIAYLTAGDPDLGTTAELMRALVRGGADIIELGVPFSDPIADGPVNQRAAARSLAAGTTLSGVLQLVARNRDRLGVPVVLFTYFNPIHARGIEVFAEQAAASGVDGVLCVDLPPDEAGDVRPAFERQGLDTIFLLAPTSDKARIRRVDQASTGFVYYVSRTGVTGAETSVAKPLIKEIQKVKRRVTKPLAVGFGIADPEQVVAVGSAADGVVVGSALVRMVEEWVEDGDKSIDRLVNDVEQRVRRLTAPLHHRHASAS